VEVMTISESNPQTVTRTAGIASAPAAEAGSWYALWTHSHCEQLAHDQLVQKGFCAFLPTVDTWSRRRGVRHLVRAPMFPSYLFLRHVMNKAAYLEVTKVRGLVRVLGERWDRLTTIPVEEMQAIEKVTAAPAPAGAAGPFPSSPSAECRSGCRRHRRGAGVIAPSGKS
jgi:transcription antitermination factor NusG